MGGFTSESQTFVIQLCYYFTIQITLGLQNMDLMRIEMDVEQFARDIKAGKSIGGSNGALGSLIKQLNNFRLVKKYKK